VLFPVDTPTQTTYGNMTGAEWLGVVFHMEQIL
jgi:hypothetical protein